MPTTMQSPGESGGSGGGDGGDGGDGIDGGGDARGVGDGGGDGGAGGGDGGAGMIVKSPFFGMLFRSESSLSPCHFLGSAIDERRVAMSPVLGPLYTQLSL